MEAKAKYNERPWLKFYPEGVPADVEIPERSLSEVFDEITSKYSDKTAIIFYGNRISFRKLREDVDRFATALYELGIK